MGVDIVGAKNFVVGNGQLNALTCGTVVIDALLGVAALHIIDAGETAFGHTVEPANGWGALEIFEVSTGGLIVTSVVMIVSVIVLIVIVIPGRIVGGDNAPVKS
jgi:hypothetical protein